MLPGTFWLPPSLKKPIDFAYVANVSSGTSTTAFTFNAVPIGAAAADRMLHVVILSKKKAAGTWTIARIGGVDLTQVSPPDSAQALDVIHSYAPLPAGTTATISLTSSVERSNVSMMVYRVADWTSPPPDATQVLSATSPVSSIIDRVAGGVVIGGAASDIGGDWAWTGLTENFDSQVENERYATASELSMAGGNLNVSVASTGGGNRRLSLCQWT